MGIGPIPASKIRDYASNVLGIVDGDEEDERFSMIIRRMDDAYVTLANSTTKDKDAVHAVRMDDVKGVKGVLDRIEKRQRTAKPKNPSVKKKH